MMEKIFYVGIDVNLLYRNFCHRLSHSSRLLSSLDFFPTLPFFIENGLTQFIKEDESERNNLMQQIFLTEYYDKYNSDRFWKRFHHYHFSRIPFELLAMSLQSLGFGYSSPYYDECIEALENIIEKLSTPHPRLLLIRNNIPIEYIEMHFKQLDFTRNMFRWILNRYRSGPITLRELSRNTVRNSLGTVRFRERVKRLHLPSEIQEFIIFPICFAARHTNPDFEVEPNPK